MSVRPFSCSLAHLCPTLWPNGLQHARLLCPPLSPGVCSYSCPLSQWCQLISIHALLGLSPLSKFTTSFTCLGKLISEYCLTRLPASIFPSKLIKGYFAVYKELAPNLPLAPHKKSMKWRLCSSHDNFSGTFPVSQLQTLYQENLMGSSLKD